MARPAVAITQPGGPASWPSAPAEIQTAEEGVGGTGGSPASQVSRFHRIAPTSPAKIMAGLTSVSSTIPPEIVLATSVGRKAPPMLRTPLTRTAALGFSAPVAMEVAIAFAVSWNPFVKSNASAVTTSCVKTFPPSMSVPCAKLSR